MNEKLLIVNDNLINILFLYIHYLLDNLELLHIFLLIFDFLLLLLYQFDFQKLKAFQRRNYFVFEEMHKFHRI